QEHDDAVVVSDDGGSWLTLVMLRQWFGFSKAVVVDIKHGGANGCGCVYVLRSAQVKRGKVVVVRGCDDGGAKVGDDGGDGGVTVVTVASAVVGWPEVVPEKWRREMKYVCV
ncbi:hypothetical protein Tco_0922698, partial [Tanacetum coccineum]